MSELYHCGLTVRDIERSYTFYREVVGLELANEGSKDNVVDAQDGAIYFLVRSEAFDTLTNNPGAEFKYLYMQSTDGKFLLQLIEYVNGGSDPVELAHTRPGSPHLCFYVSDSAEMRRVVEARGDVKITSELVQIAPTMRSFYCEDPDGVPIEFLESSNA